MHCLFLLLVFVISCFCCLCLACLSPLIGISRLLCVLAVCSFACLPVTFCCAVAPTIYVVFDSERFLGGLLPGLPVITAVCAVSSVILQYLAVLETIFSFVHGPPSPGCPGEGPDCHFPKAVGGFGPIPARIRGGAVHL